VSPAVLPVGSPKGREEQRMTDRKPSRTDPNERGLANQVSRNASLGEAWTQAKSMKPVPDGDPSQFQEFLDDLPYSRSDTPMAGGDVEPEMANLPTAADGEGIPVGQVPGELAED